MAWVAPTLTALLVLAACSDAGLGSPTFISGDARTGLAGVGRLPTPTSAWPEAGHDARFSSGTTAIGPRTGHVRWKIRLDGDATPGPVLAVDGSVLAATNIGTLYDLDPATGRIRWRFSGGSPYGSDLSTSPAVLGNGTILWPGPANTLYALTNAGTLLGRYEFAAQVLSPAVAGADRVYVSDLAGTVAALDVSAPKPREVWRIHVGGPDYASPSVGPDGTIYTAADLALVAVTDLGPRGVIRWRLRTHRLVEVSNPVASNGIVVLGTNRDREFGVAPDGHVAWSFGIGGNTYSSAIATPQGTAYFGSNAGRVWVVDTATGKIRFTVAPLGDDKESVYSAVIADRVGNFYWATTRGHLYGYTSAGHRLFSLDLHAGVHSYPAMGADGTIFVGTTYGTFYAVGNSQK